MIGRLHHPRRQKGAQPARQPRGTGAPRAPTHTTAARTPLRRRRRRVLAVDRPYRIVGAGMGHLDGHLPGARRAARAEHAAQHRRKPARAQQPAVRQLQRHGGQRRGGDRSSSAAGRRGVDRGEKSFERGKMM